MDITDIKLKETEIVQTVVTVFGCSFQITKVGLNMPTDFDQEYC